MCLSHRSIGAETGREARLPQNPITPPLPESDEEIAYKLALARAEALIASSATQESGNSPSRVTTKDGREASLPQKSPEVVKTDVVKPTEPQQTAAETRKLAAAVVDAKTVPAPEPKPVVVKKTDAQKPVAEAAKPAPEPVDKPQDAKPVVVTDKPVPKPEAKKPAPASKPAPVAKPASPTPPKPQTSEEAKTGKRKGVGKHWKRYRNNQ